MSRFLKRFGVALFILYALGAIFFLIMIDSVYNDNFYFAIKVLALPFGIMVFGFTYLNRETLVRFQSTPGKLWIIVASFSSSSILLGWPYLMAINALTADKNPIVFAGPVIEKFVTSGKTTSYNIRVHDRQSGETVEFNVSNQEYSNIENGHEWCTAFNRGLFGIPYRWRYTSNPVLNRACAKSE